MIPGIYRLTNLFYSPPTPLHNANAQQSSPEPPADRKQSFWWALIAALFVLVWAIAGLGESLWLDELHTSWTISGAVGDISARAREGNQSPFYSWLLLALTETVGHSEWVLRLPSVVSLMLSVMLLSRFIGSFRVRMAYEQSSRLTGGLAALVVIAWVPLDRIQLFYATEARVYSCLQLLSLLGWWSVLNIARDRCGTERGGFMPIVFWSILAVVSIHLHLIAILSVVWQAVFIVFFLIWKQHWTRLKNCCLALVAAAVSALPALLWAVPVWHRREQWSGFAGDASLQTVLQLFPVLQLLVPVFAVGCIDWMLARRRSIRTRATIRDIRPNRLVWFIAAAGPLITGWIVTGLGIAPVMHRRYLLCCALPIVMLAACELIRIRHAKLRLAALLAATLWLTFSQGTLQVWSSGQLIGYQRGEDWRSAARWVSERIEEGDQLWCASGLIEGTRAHPPLRPAMQEYLAFPLNGIYRVRAGDRIIEPRPLYGNTVTWLECLSSESLEARRTIYLVYRGRSSSLSRRLLELDRLAQNSGLEIAVNQQRLTATGRIQKSQLIQVIRLEVFSKLTPRQTKNALDTFIGQ